MSKQLSNISQKENIHKRAQWVDRFLQKQETKLSPENLQVLYDYNDDMIIHSMADNTRYKNLTHFSLLTKILQKNWVDVTENDLRVLVSQIMIKHGENGKETPILPDPPVTRITLFFNNLVIFGFRRIFAIISILNELCFNKFNSINFKKRFCLLLIKLL